MLLRYDEQLVESKFDIVDRIVLKFQFQIQTHDPNMYSKIQYKIRLSQQANDIKSRQKACDSLEFFSFGLDKYQYFKLAK